MTAESKLNRFSIQGSTCVLFIFIVALVIAGRALDDDWKSGQDSPVHDSDRSYSLSDQRIVLENDLLRLAFDQRTGALLELVNKTTSWKWQASPKLAESFMMFVPTRERSYNPVLGVRNTLSSFEKSSDGSTLHLVWSELQSEYQGKLQITLRGTVHLEGDTVRFDMSLANHSPETVASVSWPILGAIAEPPQSPALKLAALTYGGMAMSKLYNPSFRNQGYFGTDFPTNMVGGRFILISAPGQGLYVGAHNPDARELVKYLFELKPGYQDSWDKVSPTQTTISGHAVRLSLRVVHFPFFNAGETGDLAPIVLAPYKGDWHAGVDVYSHWKDSWFRSMPLPSWVTDVNSWQQLQINSAEDDLRTPYRELPRRAQEAAENGIKAIQLVGWNKGGQDRDNPSNDTDPRLGSTDDLRNAIAQIEKMGVHVILFAKYPWADTTTDWYKRELYKYMATDPYGNIYSGGGYRYQTPEQLAGINVRGFAAACTNDAAWREVSAHEFQKVLDLHASGLLYDEVHYHHGADFCFSSAHGHHSPATLWSGDILLGKMLRAMVHASTGETKFLFSGEDPEDSIGEIYSLSYFRIEPAGGLNNPTSDYIPEERYAFPFRPMMVAVTGFDDREMINRAVMYRYILSYEPLNFKGNIDDFPLTIRYGKLVDAFRAKFKDYLWDARFRDTLEAHVTVDGKPYAQYSVFRRKDGLRALVVTNDRSIQPLTASIAFDQPRGRRLTCASPEKPQVISCGADVVIPARSLVAIMEQQ